MSLCLDGGKKTRGALPHGRSDGDSQGPDSTATGNGTNRACGATDECADVASVLEPAVRGASSCGTSRNIEVGGTWSVCSGD